MLKQRVKVDTLTTRRWLPDWEVQENDPCSRRDSTATTGKFEVSPGSTSKVACSASAYPESNIHKRIKLASNMYAQIDEAVQNGNVSIVPPFHRPPKVKSIPPKEYKVTTNMMVSIRHKPARTATSHDPIR